MVINQDILHKLKHLKQCILKFNKNKNKNDTNNINSQNTETKCCRICFDEEETEDNKMISPCSCNGSVKWIHYNCLLRSVKLMHTDVCSICKRPYARINTSTKFSNFIRDYKQTITMISGIVGFFAMMFLSGLLWNKFLKKRGMKLNFYKFYEVLIISAGVMSAGLYFAFKYLGLIDPYTFSTINSGNLSIITYAQMSMLVFRGLSLKIINNLLASKYSGIEYVDYDPNNLYNPGDIYSRPFPDYVDNLYEIGTGNVFNVSDLNTRHADTFNLRFNLYMPTAITPTTRPILNG